MATQTETQVTFTPEASETISNIENYLYLIEMHFGQNSDENKTARQSWHQALVQIVRLGGRVSRDGDLALVGISFITYGVIFHTTYGPHCKIDGVRGTFEQRFLADERRMTQVRTCPNHGEFIGSEGYDHFDQRVIEIDGVKAGTWSVHS